MQAASEHQDAVRDRFERLTLPRRSLRALLLVNGQRSQLPGHLADAALRRRLLALADATAVLLAALLISGTPLKPSGHGLWVVVLLPAWIVLAKLHGLYDRDDRTLRHLTVDELGAILAWATVTAALVLPLIELTPTGSPSEASTVRFWLALIVTTPILRGSARVVGRRLTSPARVLLLGGGALARTTRRKLELFHDIHMVVAGTTELETMTGPAGEGLQRAVAACHGELPDRIIVCSADVREALLAPVVRLCRDHRIRLSVVPPLRGAFGTAVHLSHVAELPLVEYQTGDTPLSTTMLKRLLDVLVAAVLLVALLPVFALIAIVILSDSPGPILFRQRRAGLLGEPFWMLKFRTMVDGADARVGEVVAIDALESPMFKLRDDPRVTRVGRLLRRSSLDELPQLINVLRGEMSLVGPRPEEVALVERYQPEHRFRLEARPGMTGPMQVFGRGALEFDERLAVEREYIENPSLARDLRILLMTLPVVISGRGAH